MWRCSICLSRREMCWCWTASCNSSYSCWLQFILKTNILTRALSQKYWICLQSSRINQHSITANVKKWKKTHPYYNNQTYNQIRSPGVVSIGTRTIRTLSTFSRPSTNSNILNSEVHDHTGIGTNCDHIYIIFSEQQEFCERYLYYCNDNLEKHKKRMDRLSIQYEQLTSHLVRF